MSDTNPDQVKMLSDDVLREIESRPSHLEINGGPEPRVSLLATERDALCQTVRALRAENERLDNEPRLGCATTRQLLDEIRARIEIHHSLDYRTIDPRSDGPSHGDEVNRTL